MKKQKNGFTRCHDDVTRLTALEYYAPLLDDTFKVLTASPHEQQQVQNNHRDARLERQRVRSGLNTYIK